MSKARNLEAIYPLSPLQRGLLFHTVNEPESGLYISQLVCTVRGDLDQALLQRTWQLLVDRHPVLRTVFLWEQTGKMLQAVVRHATPAWTIEDLRGLPAETHEPRLRELLDADRAKGYDLLRAPLMRLLLVRVGDREYRLVWSHHHLLIDGWSGAVLIGEAAQIYRALRRGETPVLPDRRPYADYIAWLSRQDLSAAETFWREELAGFSTPTRLPIEIEPAAGPRRRDIRRIDATLPAVATARLQAHARRHQITLNTLAQAAWASTLSMSSGEPDIVFGAVLTSRPPALHGVESMVGMFINTLPVRVCVARDETMASWLAALQRRQAAARAFDYTPLSQIQGWSQAPRTEPLFQSALVFFNYPTESRSGEEEAGALTVSDLHAVERTSFPLFLGVSPGATLTAALAYDRGRFGDEDGAALLDRFLSILDVLSEDLERPVAALASMREGERRQVIETFNATAAPPSAQPVHELFDAQVLRTPGAIAVERDDQRLTYRALQLRAEAIAVDLRRRGVGPDMPIGIAVDRGPDMVAAVLGVLKAGGAYLPLDPDYPAERLALMLDDSRAPFVVTTRAMAARLSLPAGATMVFLEDLPAAPDAALPDAALPYAALPAVATAPGQLAYVIYTSGSTGVPKGVMISHGALANHLAHVQREPGLTPQDTVVAISTLSFDIAGLDLLLSLTTGARLVLADRQAAADPQQLAALLARSHATFLQATPVTWELLVASGWPGSATLRALSGGDTLSPRLAQAVGSRTAALWNAYGPTETTIYCTIDRVHETTGPRVSVGRPMLNSQVYVMNRRFEPMPAGVPGELLLGGDCLARGYLHRPALTAERFVPNPFGPPGSRLYHSGDLGMWTREGTLRVLGRVDRQVKLHGFRIELGEIESVLHQHPAVHQCVVTGVTDERGHKSLAAYIVARGTPAAPDALRDFVEQRLPRYMAPAWFVHLDALPLTPNAKVDHRALPAPQHARSTAAGRERYTAPRTPLERALAAVWAEVLGLDRVGAHDDFFELGGDSLLALELQSRVRRLFQPDRPVASIFQTSTVAKLADHLTQSRTEASSPLSLRHLVAFQAGGSRPPFFCVHPIGGGVSCYRALAKALGPEQPFYGLQSTELGHVGAGGDLYPRFEDMATAYVTAIQTVRPHGPYLLGGWSFGAILAYEMACQLTAAGEEVRLVTLFDMVGAERMTLTAIPDEVLVAALARELEPPGHPSGSPLVTVDELQRLPQEARLPAVLAKLRAARVVPDSTTLPVIERLLAGYRARQVLLSDYRMRPWDGRLTLFRGLDSEEEMVMLQAATDVSPDDPTCGWSRFSACVAVHQIPGNHRTILQPPHVDAVAQRLTAAIAEALADADHLQPAVPR